MFYPTVSMLKTNIQKFIAIIIEIHGYFHVNKTLKNYLRFYWQYLTQVETVFDKTFSIINFKF